MNGRNRVMISAAFAALLSLAASPGSAQPLIGVPADSQFE